MGIPRLRHHISPFSESILLQQKNDSTGEETTCIQSVVIDGPSLVYNVFSRLLSWFSESSNSVLEAMPTCNEVSCGVMVYLLQLRALGVKIERIYFDGALPAQKHETRLLRLEKSRGKLELFCSRTNRGFEMPKMGTKNRIIRPEYVFCSRALSARYKNIPDNPFMVPAVFEDLNYRWDKARITASVAGDTLLSLDFEGFPWASVTFMVPGEADAHCVYTARLTGSSILTNDSDLLLYDLGVDGSVIFLDSVSRIEGNTPQSMKIQITASTLRPRSIARRLGISNMLSLAYELKCHPSMGFIELMRRSKELDTEARETTGYRNFAEEYCLGWIDKLAENSVQQPQNLDPRVSELICQYDFPHLYMPWDCPHVYLAVLNEDSAKQCVWGKGLLYRTIGYSILNMSHPADKQFAHVNEFVRRGGRITADQVSLGNREWIISQLRALQVRLSSMQIELGENIASPTFWRIFVLCDLYGTGTDFTTRDIRKLTRFLEMGCMGKKPGWADVHLVAQIQSVFYSFRILKQLIAIAGDSEVLTICQMPILNSLPPLHVMMEPVCEKTREYVRGIPISEFVGLFSRLLNPRSLGCAELDEVPKRNFGAPLEEPKNKQSDKILLHGDVNNMYDLLPEQ